MPVPVWSVGQVLTAGDVNSWFVPLAAYKASDQSVTSSVTLVNDSALVIPLAANAVYDFELFLVINGPALGTGDFKMGWTYPAGTTMVYARAGFDTTNTWVFNKTLQTDVVAFGTTGSGVPVIRCSGTVVTAATAGNLQLQWAQNTSSTTATVVKAGSDLTAQRIG